MLSKFNPRQGKNELSKVFDYNGFAEYCLNADRAVKVDLGVKPNKERLVFSLKGELSVNGRELSEKDMMYLPIGSPGLLETKGSAIAFVAESSGSKKYEPYVIKYSGAPRMNIGQQSFRRTVVQTITEKEPANRFIAGYVEGSPGEWTSFPPHKHDDKPEAYTFYNVDPGFAIQVVLDGDDEKAYVVHDYDTVLIERGYHPEVNTSLTAGCYAWVISAPEDSRNLGVEIHPAFTGINLGKSHLTINK